VDNELAVGCILWDISRICTRNPIRSNRKTVRSGDPNILSLVSFVSGVKERMLLKTLYEICIVLF
jgi:hypothetical protein